MFVLNSYTIRIQHAKDLNIYYIPVKKNETVLGLLMVISKANGAVYRSIYQNMKDVDMASGGGVMTIEINGAKLAEFSIKRVTKGDGEEDVCETEMTRVFSHNVATRTATENEPKQSYAATGACTLPMMVACGIECI